MRYTQKVQLLVALGKVVADIANKKYPYYHVSDHKNIPIPLEHNNKHDPYGVYLFIKGEYVDVANWAYKKYRWDAKLKPNLRLLNLSKINFETALKLFKASGLKNLMEVWNIGKREERYRGAYDLPHEEINALFYPLNVDKDNPTEAELKANLVSKKHIYVYRILRLQYPYKFKTNKAFSNVFQKLGYDGLIDKDGIIYPQEPQVVIFEPKNIIWDKREINKPDEHTYCLPTD